MVDSNSVSENVSMATLVAVHEAYESVLNRIEEGVDIEGLADELEMIVWTLGVAIEQAEREGLQ